MYHVTNLVTDYTAPTLLVQRLHFGAKVPKKGTDQAAAYDIYALNEGVVPAGGSTLVKTGIAISIPQPFTNGLYVYASVRSRSGLSVKHGIEVGAGVIDRDYRGEVGVVLYNFGKTDFTYGRHERVGQLVLEVHLEAGVAEVDILPATGSNRTGGFGSTGY